MRKAAALFGLAGALAALSGSAVAQSSGQAFMYDAQGRLRATTVAVPNSGSATVYGMDTGGARTSRARALTTARAGGQQWLASGETLLPFQELKSADNRFVFSFQADGNAVIYWLGVGSLWSTNTAGGASVTLTMEAGGNLVMKDYRGSVVFESNTGGNPGAYMRMGNDADLVIYDAGGTQIWHSGTCCH